MRKMMVKGDYALRENAVFDGNTILKDKSALLYKPIDGRVMTIGTLPA